MKIMVLSYDSGEQQAFYDLVEAETKQEAEQMVADVRDYAEVTDSFTQEEMAFTFGSFTRKETVPTTRAALAKLECSPKAYCVKCDVALDEMTDTEEGLCIGCS